MLEKELMERTKMQALIRKRLEQPSDGATGTLTCLVVPGGDAGRAGDEAGLSDSGGALPQPQPRAGSACAEYNTAFASWVCGPLPSSAAVEELWCSLDCL